MKHSQLDIAKYKGRVLDQIMSWKRQEVESRMEELPLDQIRAFCSVSPPALDFGAALTAQPGTSLIAEIKRASPSRGLIAKDWDPALMGEIYVREGAAAISCLTDSRFFQGQLEYLTSVKERLREKKLSAPVLRKDFIYHEYQVYEARMAGADAILLIVSVLGDSQLKSLLSLSRKLGMEALIECHDEDEVARALDADALVIGINNRDLRTFDVDISTTERLRASIPKEKIVVAESGIRTTDDVTVMVKMGADAILVGETFSKLPQSQRAAKVREFVEAGRKVTE